MTTTELLRDKIRQREDGEREAKRRQEASSVVLAAHFAPVRNALNELHRDGVLIQIEGKTVVFPEVTGSGCSIAFSGRNNFPHCLYSDRTRYILMDTRTTRYYDKPEEAVEAFLESMMPYFRAAKTAEKGDLPIEVTCSTCLRHFTLYFNGGELDSAECEHTAWRLSTRRIVLVTYDKVKKASSVTQEEK